jgi:hypothetical protein
MQTTSNSNIERILAVITLAIALAGLGQAARGQDISRGWGTGRGGGSIGVIDDTPSRPSPVIGIIDDTPSGPPEIGVIDDSIQDSHDDEEDYLASLTPIEIVHTEISTFHFIISFRADQAFVPTVVISDQDIEEFHLDDSGWSLPPHEKGKILQSQLGAYQKYHTFAFVNLRPDTTYHCVIIPEHDPQVVLAETIVRTIQRNLPTQTEGQAGEVDTSLDEPLWELLRSPWIGEVDANGETIQFNPRHRLAGMLPGFSMAEVTEVKRGGTFGTMHFQSQERFKPWIVLSTEPLPLDYDPDSQTFSWPEAWDVFVKASKPGPFSSQHETTFMDLAPDQKYYFTIFSKDTLIVPVQGSFQTMKRHVEITSNGLCLVSGDGAFSGTFIFGLYAVNHELGLPWHSKPKKAFVEFGALKNAYDLATQSVAEDTPWDDSDNPAWEGIVPYHDGMMFPDVFAGEGFYLTLSAGEFLIPRKMTVSDSNAPGFWLIMRGEEMDHYSFETYTYPFAINAENQAGFVEWIDLGHRTHVNNGVLPGSSLREREEFTTVLTRKLGWYDDDNGDDDRWWFQMTHVVEVSYH